MKEKIGQLKELAGKLSSKTKKIIIAGVVVLIVGAVVIALILNNQPYETLFTGLGQEEAKQITQKLQEDGIDFKYDGDSEILVRKDILDQTKAALVQEGYPKSGFTYDTFKNNAGMLTTDSDKNTYKLYDLQDRIGATIRSFSGVKDAKVTIALGEESKYALDDETKKSSASVVVTMQDGGSPSTEQVMGIQRLVAKSVPEMELADVAVLDGNGNDVSVEAENGSTSATSSDAEEIAQVVENQIANNVMKVLGPIYGQENVRVSARAQINMQNLMRESISYSTPEKIDEEDKTGIVSKEEGYRDGNGGGDGAGGVAGSETNADADEYNTDSELADGSSYSESYSREYLVDQIKEQGQVTPGALDDLTVSVAINGNGYGNLQERQLRALIGNAAGIATVDQNDKIAIVSAPFNDGASDDGEEEKTGLARLIETVPLWALIAAGVLLLVLIIVIILLIVRKKGKDEEEDEEAAALAEEGAGIEAVPTLDLNAELQEMQNDRGMELKRSIRDFAEQNSEISAQLLRNWLNGGNGDGE